MSKQKKAQITRTLKEILDSYDSVTLSGVIATLNDSLAWQILEAFLKFKQREYEVISLDKAGKSNQSNETAYSSGYAKAIQDVRETYMQEMYDAVQGYTGVVESQRPAEISIGRAPLSA